MRVTEGTLRNNYYAKFRNGFAKLHKEKRNLDALALSKSS